MREAFVLCSSIPVSDARYQLTFLTATLVSQYFGHGRAPPHYIEAVQNTSGMVQGHEAAEDDLCFKLGACGITMGNYV